MKNTNHTTPGPWHLTETEPGIDADMDIFTMAPRYAGGTALVARVMHADDALVIAAAPDMLAALKRAEYHIQGQEYLDALGVIRIAIARATGQGESK